MFWLIMRAMERAAPTEYLMREDVRAQFEVNVFAPFQLCTLVVPIMRKQGEGRIINTSSINSRLAVPMGGLYSASKAAIELLTDAFRIELAPLGIKVILVIPGTTNTGAFDTMAEDARSYLNISGPYITHSCSIGRTIWSHGTEERQASRLL
jgi:NAD(P)-dependent dehydrogenase (short-subunit alcohol dehydrogenase family)